MAHFYTADSAFGITYMDFDGVKRRDVVTFKLGTGADTMTERARTAKYYAQCRARESVRPVGFTNVRVVLVDVAFMTLPMIGD